MTIEEKKTALEFNFTHDEIKDLEYNIIYDFENTSSLTIRGNNQEITCPVKMIEEVFLFLKKKGVITPSENVNNANENLLPNSSSNLLPNSSPNLLPNSLPVPQIKIDNKNTSFDSNIDPLDSFDISKVISLKKEDVNNENIITNISVPEVKNIEQIEPINRQVIRSRVEGEDPLSAEKEAARIRGSGAGAQKKGIKKIREAENGV
jgi:hypothetical protein